MKIPNDIANDIVMIATEEYSDYCTTPYKVLKPFTFREAHALFLSLQPAGRDCYGDLYNFTDWLRQQGYIQHHSYYEMHIGSYGELKIEGQIADVLFEPTPNEVAWTTDHDSFPLRYSMSLDAAAGELKKLYEAWPGGLDEIESALLTATAQPVLPPCTWHELNDEDRRKAFESMPDMLDGFLKTWGWLHFAKAIEAKCREKNITQAV